MEGEKESSKGFCASLSLRCCCCCLYSSSVEQRHFSGISLIFLPPSLSLSSTTSGATCIYIYIYTLGPRAFARDMHVTFFSRVYSRKREEAGVEVAATAATPGAKCSQFPCQREREREGEAMKENWRARVSYIEPLCLTGSYSSLSLVGLNNIIPFLINFLFLKGAAV